MDSREEILNNEYRKWVNKIGLSSIYPAFYPEAYREAAINAMDEYMKECCIALLEYVAFNTTDTLVDVSGVKFKYKGEWITKERLFENFL